MSSSSTAGSVNGECKNLSDQMPQREWIEVDGQKVRTVTVWMVVAWTDTQDMRRLFLCAHHYPPVRAIPGIILSKQRLIYYPLRV